MATEERPGGWVPGIGWVALLHDVAGLDCWTAEDATPVSPEGWTCYGEAARLCHLNRPIIVTRWADDTTPTPPDPFAAVRALPEYRALWVARAVVPMRGASGPGVGSVVDSFLIAIGQPSDNPPPTEGER